MDLWSILSTVTLKCSTLKGWMKMNSGSLLSNILPFIFLLVLRVIPSCVMGWTVPNRNIDSALWRLIYSCPSPSREGLGLRGESGGMWRVWSLREALEDTNPLGVPLLPFPPIFWFSSSPSYSFFLLPSSSFFLLFFF